jgi:hypothetical protein
MTHKQEIKELWSDIMMTDELEDYLSSMLVSTFDDRRDLEQNCDDLYSEIIDAINTLNDVKGELARKIEQCQYEQLRR